MYPLRLQGARVMLREFDESDLDMVLGVVGDDRVTEHLSFDSRTRDQARAMVRETIVRARRTPRNEYYLAVVVADEHLVGFARLGLTGVRAAKLGYAIAADHWRRGYATDATRTLLDFGFRTLGLHRVSAAIGPDNTASIALVRRLGMTIEGRIRDHVYTNGQWRDSLLYSVLSHEWPASVARSLAELGREPPRRSSVTATDRDGDAVGGPT